MYQFNLSAPGTVFIAGDPVRENNKTCVAASLDMRTKLSFTSLLPSVIRPYFIEIDFTSINFHIKIPVDTFLMCFFRDNSYRTLSNTLLHNAIRNFVPSLLILCETKCNKKDYQLSLEAFLYLLLSIAFKENMSIESSFVVKVSTELPVGKGLGSSASFVVSLAACFWRWSLLQKKIVRNEFNGEDLIAIVDYARCCSCIIYNFSDMINTNVSVFGSITCYKEAILQTGFFHFPSMKILLVSSNVNKNMITTQKQTTCSSLQYNNILDYINNVTKSTTQVLRKFVEKTYKTDQVDISDQPRLSKRLYEKLSSLIKLNQNFLKAIDMSHPNLDNICTVAHRFSLSGKITGGGTYAFILLPPDITDETISQISHELNALNFRTIVTNVGCVGVRLE